MDIKYSQLDIEVFLVLNRSDRFTLTCGTLPATLLPRKSDGCPDVPISRVYDLRLPFGTPRRPAYPGKGRMPPDAYNVQISIADLPTVVAASILDAKTKMSSFGMQGPRVPPPSYPNKEIMQNAHRISLAHSLLALAEGFVCMEKETGRSRLRRDRPPLAVAPTSALPPPAAETEKQADC
ncbi:hypothetical protein PG988_012526 [Apiospora saccharicola]